MIQSRNTNYLKSKTLSLNVTDIDPATRKVVGYFASFNTIDSDDDMILKGAFAKSIEEKGPLSASNRKIAHLWNHDWNEPIGKILELHEDDYGLKFVSQLGRSQKGQDVFLNYQDGILREHSVGFYYLPEGTRLINDGKISYAEISLVDLVEGSTVTFGANSLTPVIDVTKGEDVEEALNQLNTEMMRYYEILRNGTGSDERFYEIEMGLKTLQAKYFELLSPKEVVTKEIEVIPVKKATNILKHYLN